MSNTNSTTVGPGNINNTSSLTRLPRLTVQGDSKTEFLVNKADGTNVFTVDTITPLITTNCGLTVNGTLTYNNITVLTTTNPEIKLADGNLANTYDIGYYGEYSLDGKTPLYMGLYRDHTDSIFKFYNGLTTEPTTTVPGGYTLASIQVGNSNATRNFVGDGSVSNPAYSFTSETGSGLYRIGASDIGFSISGTKQLELTSTGIITTGDSKATTFTIGSTSLNSTSWGYLSNINQNLGTSGSPGFFNLSAFSLLMTGSNIQMAGGNILGGGSATFTNFNGALNGNATTATTAVSVSGATQSSITSLPSLTQYGTTGITCFFNGNLRIADGGIQFTSGSINFGGVGGINNAGNIQLLTGAASGYLAQSDGSGNMSWVNPSSLSPTFSKLTLTANTSSPAALNIGYTASASQTLLESFTVSGNKRWQWYVSGSESGANAGSDLVLDCYSDAGSRLADAMIITRATGSIMLGAALNLNSQNITNIATASGSTASFTTLTGTLSTVSQPNVTTMTGLTTIGALTSLTMVGAINMPNNTAITFKGTTGNLAENIYTDGSNNLVMSWYNSSGVYQGDALKIQNSNGNILGTLGTAAQTNITSLGSLTGLRVNGLVGINQAGATPYYLGISIDNTNYGGLNISGTSTDNTAASHYGAYIGPSYKPTNTNSNYYTCLQASPIFASSTSQTLSGPCSSIYVSDFFTGNAGTITTAYGLFYDGGGSLPGGAINTHYGGYFAQPTAGSVKIALYAQGITTQAGGAPPTNGIYSLGHIQLASSANIAVNGGTAASTIGLTSSLPLTCGAGSTSLNGLALFTDNTTGINFGTGTINLCASGANQAVVTNGGFAISNGTTFSTSQTNISGDAAHMLLRASNTNRWGFGLQGSESSANAGSNFVLFDYKDDGSFLSDALIITRSNNKFSPQGPVNLVTYTDNTNGNLTAGSYTPTIANVTNVSVANSTAGTHFYQRVGDRVHIDGYCTIGSSGAGLTTFTFTLTIPTGANFSGTADAVGNGSCYEVTSATNRSTCNVGSTNAAQTLNVSVTTFSSAPATTANNIYVGYSITYRVR